MQAFGKIVTVVVKNYDEYFGVIFKVDLMNKYAFTLHKEIQVLLEEENDFSFDTRIADVFSENFDELSWITVLVYLELTYGFSIPDSLAEHTNLTIEEYGRQLSQLPVIATAIYPEFYELKIQVLENVLREYKITTGFEEGTEEELTEIRERLELIQERLDQITEFPLN